MNHEKGAALLTVVVISLLLSTIAANAFNEGTRQAILGEKRKIETKALVAAEGGANAIIKESKYSPFNADNILFKYVGVTDLTCNTATGLFFFGESPAECLTALDEDGEILSQAILDGTPDGECLVYGSTGQHVDCYTVTGIGTHSMTNSKAAVEQNLAVYSLSDEGSGVYEY